MRYVFFIITAIVTTFSSAHAGGNGDENLGRLTECELRDFLGEPPCRRLTQEEVYLLGKTIEALGNIAGAAIVNDRDMYYRPASRVRRYNNEGEWIYRGGGWVLGDGDVCYGRHQYNPINGRTYCVR